MRRLGKPEEVAAAVRFFADDSASFITGQTLSGQRGPDDGLTQATRTRTENTKEKLMLDGLEDVLYEIDSGLATVTINRPDRFNAFRAQTVDEIIRCFKHAWVSGDVGVVCLTGAGDRAFCAGGDQKQRNETGDYGPSQSGLFEIESLHRVLRDIPKPVIAAVNGYAIGGGHVLHVLCDLTIASDKAVSARTVRGSDPSTPAWVVDTWPGSWARSARGRSGSCAASSTLRPRCPGALLMPLCRTTS